MRSLAEMSEGCQQITEGGAAALRALTQSVQVEAVTEPKAAEVVPFPESILGRNW